MKRKEEPTFTIFKFSIPDHSTFSLELPANAQFLDVQVQRGDPQAWFLLDPQAPKMTRQFVIAPTGGAVTKPERLTYLGTFQLLGGSIVLHLFEQTEKGTQKCPLPKT